MRNLRRALRATLLFAVCLTSPTASGQAGPGMDVREKALQSLVYITATECTDNTVRAGSGFALEEPGRIVACRSLLAPCGTAS